MTNGVLAKARLFSLPFGRTRKIRRNDASFKISFAHIEGDSPGGGHTFPSTYDSFRNNAAISQRYLRMVALRSEGFAQGGKDCSPGDGCNWCSRGLSSRNAAKRIVGRERTLGLLWEGVDKTKGQK